MNLKRSIVYSLKQRNKERTRVKALDDVSIHFTSGSRIGLIGENGAGKTTLLRTIGGALPPSKGSLKTEGKIHSFLGSPLHGLDQEMSGYENIELISLINGQKVKKNSHKYLEIAEFTGLGQRLEDPVFTYSTGMKARLRFSILTSFNSDILLVDEGIGAADYAFSSQSHDRLTDFLGRAGILVFASHSQELLRPFCDLGLWISEGKIVKFGTFDEVYQSYIVDVKNNKAES